MPLTCPHCQARVEPAEPAVREILCPACGFSFCPEQDATVSWTTPGGPRAIGKFVLVEMVGSGGFGAVYKARDPQLDRTVAIKVPRSGHLADRADIDRFLREARSVARLRHPAIVPVYEVGQHDGLPYLASEFVQGLTLSELLSGRRPSPREAAELVAAVAGALHYAHEQGVVHRDVKPSNILLDDRGRPHLMDFGLARRDAGDATMTADGQVLGTPAYMSPEQARGEGHRVDGRSDIYSLGVVLYQLLTGELPFRGTPRMLLHQVLHDEPRPPRRLNDQVPRDLETICLKAMAKEPSRRYATAGALADDLANYLADRPIAARRIGPAERALRWCRRNPASAALAGVTALALVTLAGLGVALSFQSRLRVAYAEVDRQRARAEVALNTNRVLFAHRELVEHNPYRAEELLDDCPPDRRGWEWHYLKRQCHPELLAWIGHEGHIERVAFSPDGRRIISAGEDRTVRVWDDTTGRRLRTWDGYHNPVSGLAVSPDGRRFASSAGVSGRPEPVLIRDLESGRILFKISVPTGNHCGIAFSRDGRRLVIAGGDLADGRSSVHVRDATTGESIQTLPTRGEPAYFPSFHPDGTRVIATVGAASSDDPAGAINRVVVWNVATGREQFRLTEHRAPVVFATFSPDGKFIVSGGYDEMVRVWDGETGRLLRELAGHQNCVNQIAFSPDGRRFASASDDNSVIVWDAAGGKPLLSLSGHEGGIFGLAFHPDGTRLVTCGYRGQIKLWDATTSRDNQTLPAPSRSAGVSSLAFNHRGDILAAACMDGTVRLWDLARGQLKATLTGHQHPVWGVAFSPDDRWIASAAGAWRHHNQAGEVYLWDARTTRRVHALEAHRGVAWTVAFSPDGARLASGGGEIRTHNDRIVIWDVASGDRLHTIPCPEGGIRSIAFHPDGREIAAATGALARTWDVETGRTLVTFAGHQHAINQVVYSPDGGRLATGGMDLTIRIWSAGSGAEERRLLGHNFEVRGLAYSPAGRRVASVGGDKKLKIWDAETGQELLSLGGHESYIRAVAFSPDGHRIATADQQGMIKVWDGMPVIGAAR